jgi:hypothetical protein
MMWIVTYEDNKPYGLFSSEEKAINTKQRLEAFYENVVVKPITPIEESEDTK